MKLIALAAVQHSIPVPTLSKSQSKELQTALSLLGYPVGDIDGLIGKNTKGAWAQFVHTISQIDEERTKRAPKVVTALIARKRNGQIILVKRAVSR